MERYRRHRRVAAAMAAAMWLASGGVRAASQVASQAVTDMTNTASMTYLLPSSTDPVVQSSNVAHVSVSEQPPDIEFSGDPEGTQPIDSSHAGGGIYVGVNAPGCAQSSTEKGHVEVTITALATGDTETFIAEETETDSSVFRVPQKIVTFVPDDPTKDNESIMEVLAEDAIEARVTTCGGTDVDVVLIDPVGVVFDSQTNEPIAGAVVSLIDVTGAGNGGNPGGEAEVYEFDGLTRLPGVQTTGADGRYQFPFVPESSYRLIVTPPGDYTFPSTVPRDKLAAGRTIVDGSYALDFEVSRATGPVTIDVPLDTTPNGLIVQKTAARPTVEVGETMAYTVTMRNISGLALVSADLEDDLPRGFTYLKGSARMNGAPIPDPSGGKGPQLHFRLGPMAGDGQAELVYRATAGPGALEGDGINWVRLTSLSPARKISNLASAKVQVEGGVFDEKAYVLGKIYADCDRNGLQDEGEPGVPRVRLYMEDGTFVDSDSLGQYSLYGLIPRTHVMKVDATTLPEGAKLEPLSHRHAGSGATLFVDLHKGELHRADFAVEGCSDPVRKEIAARNAVGNAINELTRSVRTELRTEEMPLGDVRALAASGFVGSELSTRTDPSVPKAVPRTAAAAGAVPLQELLPKLDDSLTFIDFSDGDTVSAAQITVRVKGHLGTTLQLLVNDEPISENRIGMRVSDNPRRIEAREYIGVDLRPGDNVLTLVQRDVGGNARSIRTIHITAPGEMARIVTSTVERSVPADGAHSARIVVELQDAAGIRSGFRAPVTLESTMGEWNVADLDPREPGVQVFVEGGRSEFELRGPATAGVAEVRATSGSNVGIESTTQVEFVPALRPMIGVGVVEGSLSLNKLSAGSLVAAGDNDGFERELTQFSSDGKLTGGARAALFLKGKVRGDYLLTLGYDSDKDTRERLFRDIQPDRFYPVYGDSSVKGFDAQSTSRLYVRIDRNRSYLLAGDFTTQALSEARKLGAYNRSLNGLTEHYERGGFAVRGFASHDNARHVVDEIPANGTSGPYALSSTDALENSEQVEILVRDRDQPAVIISATPQQRFSDYEIEAFTGRLLFRAPVPSVDANLNPISIRISYDVEQGGKDFLTAGLDSRITVTNRLEIGASVVEDRNPEDKQRIVGTNATFKLGDVTTLIAEAAHTRRHEMDEDEHDGLGARLELRHEGTQTQVRAYAARTDEEFDNPSGYMTGNRSEAGAKAAYSVNSRTRLLAEALHTGDVTTGAKRDGALIGIERSFARSVKIETGVRHVIDTPADDAPPEALKDDTTSVRTKLTAPVPGLARATLFGEYEQDVSDSDQRVLAFGGEYHIRNRTRFYARQEVISSLSGPYALDPNQRHNTTVFGLDSTYLGDDHMFSEYRVGNGLSGREAQAAIGLRNRWAIAQGLRLDTTLERVDALSGSPESESNAVTGAIEYTRNPLWKGTARLELRDGATSDGILSTLGIAYKLAQDWTFLGKNVFALTDNSGRQPDREQERLQLGFAYRDGTTNRWNGLGRYEFKREEGVEAGTTRLVHLISTHMDYQLRRTTVVRGQLAAKHFQEDFLGMRAVGDIQLIAARITQDIGKRWDLGFAVRALFPGSFDDYQGGLGAEAGYLIRESLWLSAGYNVVGFHDDDLAGENYTRRGAFVRIRFKFDETLLN